MVRDDKLCAAWARLILEQAMRMASIFHASVVLVLIFYPIFCHCVTMRVHLHDLREYLVGVIFNNLKDEQAENVEEKWIENKKNATVE